jgi:hypothetical protein
MESVCAKIFGVSASNQIRGKIEDVVDHGEIEEAKKKLPTGSSFLRIMMSGNKLVQARSTIRT